MRRLLVRGSVILFWVTLILAILYWPEGKIFPSRKRSINVFAWGDILEQSVIADFEKKTGIKVHLNYYASNEELLVKLKATGGEGYDLIVPSDYSVEILAKERLLKEIEKSRLTFWKNLNPALLGHTFDPKNQFSIPFEWELFILGINKPFFDAYGLEPSWKTLFDPSPVRYRVAMINDPVEAILLAAFYLYGPIDHLSAEQLAGVTELLIRQKKWVAAYADFRADYFLATKNCPVALASTSYIWRTMKKFPFVGFVVPKEGTFVTIENLCIPAASNKEELTYQLINFLYSPESMARHYNEYGTFPATLDALPFLHLDPETEKIVNTPPETFNKLYFMRMLTSQENIRDTWVKVKSS
jgi:spermidine/putrescine transport system substrate-binding protein